METLGEFLRRWRKRASLSQEDAGKLCSVSRQTINNWESDGSSPTTDRLVQLLEGYSVPRDIWSAALEACAGSQS